MLTIHKHLPKSAYIIGWLTTPVLPRSLLQGSRYSFIARIIIPRNPHGPEELDVHGSDAVVVRFVSALATVQVLMMIPVFLADSTAFRTTLGGVPRRHFQDFRTVLMSLVSQELLQLVESPAPQLIVLFRGSGKIAFFEADASKVLEYEKRILAIFLYECLRNLMVHIRHPTVLSPRDSFEFTLC